MFFEPRKGHDLPHDPFRAIVAPRPIGWATSLSADGIVNLAPYSFFNGVSNYPPMVMISSEGIKDSITNIRDTGEFVVNLATEALAQRMNETSRAHPAHVDEFEPAGLTPAPCRLVRPPRVKESPAALECKVTSIVPLPDLDGDPGERLMAVGEVVGIHIDESCLKDGLFDMVAAGTIARCGYWDYARVTELFQMPRPDLAEHKSYVRKDG
ncbi:MAG: flavin reductase family protein [Pseudomonadota bacterium]|nr:flavin reductase family protein [Pseudomonadota bacterium]